MFFCVVTLVWPLGKWGQIASRQKSRSSWGTVPTRMRDPDGTPPHPQPCSLPVGSSRTEYRHLQRPHFQAHEWPGWGWGWEMASFWYSDLVSRGKEDVSSCWSLFSKLISDMHPKEALRECSLGPESQQKWKLNDLHHGTEDSGLGTQHRRKTLCPFDSSVTSVYVLPVVSQASSTGLSFCLLAHSKPAIKGVLVL